MIRVASVGDLHVPADGGDVLREQLQGVEDCADLLLVAGDLTTHGGVEEADVVAEVLGGLPLPVICVLGNHDVHDSGGSRAVGDRLSRRGVVCLDGTTSELSVGATTVGLAGVTGFGGGFPGATASEFGEPEMKAFVRRTRRHAARLERALRSLRTDVRIAVMHYAPVADTVRGEPEGIHAFLGSYLLAEAVDRAGADLIIHGHAHRGSEFGRTAHGIPVRNVAQPVIEAPYRIYLLEPRPPECSAGDVGSAAGATQARGRR